MQWWREGRERERIFPPRPCGCMRFGVSFGKAREVFDTAIFFVGMWQLVRCESRGEHCLWSVEIGMECEIVLHEVCYCSCRSSA